MASRFVFPPINLGAAIELQLTHRADWVGYRLERLEDQKEGVFWRLSRKVAGAFKSHKYYTLVEVDMKLCQLLEEIGERIDQEEYARLAAARALKIEVMERLDSAHADAVPTVTVVQ